MSETTSAGAVGRSDGNHANGQVLARTGWVLLLLLGLLYAFAALSDLVATSRGLPSDHAGTFHGLAGSDFAHFRLASPGPAGYVMLLERGYALHELTFAVLYLAVIAIPFRRRQRWAWWAAWTPTIANVGYALTFGLHDPAILGRATVAAIALPVLLLAHAPAFFRSDAQRDGEGDRPPRPSGARHPSSR